MIEAKKWTKTRAQTREATREKLDRDDI